MQTLATALTRRLDQFARRVTLFIIAVRADTFAFGHPVRGMPLLEIFLAVVGQRWPPSPKACGHRDHRAGHRYPYHGPLRMPSM